MEFTAREARLKPEFAEQYPQVEAGVWVPAAELGAQVLLWQVQQQGTAALATRILDERHFEFRGGPPETRPAGARSRRTDVPGGDPTR